MNRMGWAIMSGGVGILGLLLAASSIWLLWTALHYYTHQVIAGVLLVGFLAFLGWGLSGVRVSVKRREWDE